MWLLAEHSKLSVAITTRIVRLSRVRAVTTTYSGVTYAPESPPSTMKVEAVT